MPLFFDPFKTRARDGTEEQGVDGGVRAVTPLSSALEINPRGVLAVRASPAPQPGPVRTFPNLIKIGLRAVHILQSEASANNLSVAALYKDLIPARESHFRMPPNTALRRAHPATPLRPPDEHIPPH